MNSVEYAGMVCDCHAAVLFGFSWYRAYDDILHACNLRYLARLQHRQHAAGKSRCLPVQTQGVAAYPEMCADNMCSAVLIC